MANHAFVTSRKKQDPKVINDILAELNRRLFKGNLQIEFSYQELPFWEVNYVSPNKNNYCFRTFWLDSPRKFEMRHGPGGDFAWWIDSAICNEVALAYDGTISDEGVGERWKGEPNKYDNLAEFVKLMMDHIPEPQKTAYRWLTVSMFPPEFRAEI